jgi:periplasmic protein TonB
MSAANETFDDVVFEFRNREYGAYDMRRRYSRSIIIATAIGIAVFVLLASIPAISSWINKMTEVKEVKKDTKVELAEVKAPDEPLPPPPPPQEVEPPKVDQIKFTPPDITDEEIKEEDLPPPQEDLSKTNVSTQTQEGETDFIDLPDPNAGKLVVEEEAPPQIFQVVEQMPQFPGGDDALLKYLSKNIKYPEIARDANTQGTIFVSFVVDENGRIGSAQVLRGLNGPGAKDCANEALRVVNSMPAWAAGKQNGKAVRVQFNLPVKFTLR